jgi:hypothetical protein
MIHYANLLATAIGILKTMDLFLSLHMIHNDAAQDYDSGADRSVSLLFYHS